MFNIKDTDLARELGISLERLYQIVDFFDSDGKDEWELVEGVDFKFTTKKRDVRIFSREGAFAIASYMKYRGDKTIWERIWSWVNQREDKVRQKEIEAHCIEVIKSGEGIVRQNGITFFSNKLTAKLLNTNTARLNKAFVDIQRSDMPLSIGEDFNTIDNVRHWSSPGVVKVSHNLSNTLTNKARREWVKDIGVIYPKVQKALDAEEEAKANRVKRACELARKRDKSTCQLTGEKPNSRTNRFNLASHHLFSKAHYPNLAESVDNIITIKEEIHQEFHNYMGGYNVACTIDDFIKFTIERYPDADLLKLSNIKDKLIGR